MQKKRLIILGIIILNLLFVLVLFNQFYYRKASFDTSKMPSVSGIEKVSSGDGKWTWRQGKIDFYNDYTINLNKTEITQFCEIVNSSHAKYIENVRPEEWFDIYLINKKGEEILLTLKKNDQGIFFEIDNDAFEGNMLNTFLENKIRKNN